MMTDAHFKQVCRLLDTFDTGWNYVSEYNSLLHNYNGIILYQAESQFIHKIGGSPGITITELSQFFGKTVSACSQLINRMKKKGFLVQKRNQNNNREHNLYLTENGEQLYQFHKDFERRCYKRTTRMLEIFFEEELKIYPKIQTKMNESFLLDVTENESLELNNQPAE